MAGQDKQHIGDGGDDVTGGARHAADAAKQFGQQSAEKAAVAGAETASASSAAVNVGIQGSTGAVSATAAGAAAGGPWGAIISAAWSMRHTLFKLLVCACLILLFFITAIISLPAVVTNNLFRLDPDSVDPDGPTDLLENYRDLSAAIERCISSGHDAAFAKVENIIASGGYDYQLSMEAVINNAYGSRDYDVSYIMAAYSASIEQQGAAKSDMERKLKAVAGKMFPVTYIVKETTRTVPAVEEGEEDAVVTICYVECTIHPFENGVILEAFNIDTDAEYSQFSINVGSAIDNMALALKKTLYLAMGVGDVPEIVDEELLQILGSLTCSERRKEIIRCAFSLVGRAPYFWGGKSEPGWNPEWNTPKLVTSTGSKTSGTLRPYGLDCSGFTQWTYMTALGVEIDHGTTAQWYNCEEISESELRPGDLGFQRDPSFAGADNHVLIYVGNIDGKQLWVHCAGGTGVVCNSPTYVSYFRRVKNADLESDDVPNRSGSANFSAIEIEWLAALGYYEARGMDTYCRQLVMQVAVNRVGSPKFPNTLREVLMAPRQYGWPDPSMTATLILNNKYRSVKENYPSLWNTCYQEALLVASGKSLSPEGTSWPADVLYQHSFVDKNANGIGHYRTFWSGSYWMHFNYG